MFPQARELPSLLIRWLASRRLATAVLTAWLLLLVVWVVPFELYGLPSQQIRAIVLGEPFFQALYALLVVSTVGCIVPRLIQGVRRAGAGPSETFAAAHSSDSDLTDARAQAWVSRLGRLRFGRLHVGPGYVWGVRGRWAALASSGWHLAFAVLVIAMSLYLGEGGPKTMKFALTVGETFTGEPQQFADSGSGSTYSQLPRPLPPLRVKQIQVEFFEDMLLFTRLATTLDVSGSQRSVSLGNPLWVAPSSWVAIEDFGYSVDVEFLADDAEPVRRTFRTKTFPAGTGDTFESPALGSGVTTRTYRFDMQVFGDYVDDGGTPSNRSFNRANPYVMLTAWRVFGNGQVTRVLGPELVRVGSTVDLGEDRMVVHALPYYGVFRITNSPWALAVLASFVLLSALAALRLLFPRTEVYVFADAAGRPTVRVVRELYGEHPELERRITEQLGAADER